MAGVQVGGGNYQSNWSDQAKTPGPGADYPKNVLPVPVPEINVPPPGMENQTQPRLKKGEVEA